MSHGESKVELSQAELKHVCQVEQKGKRSSGFGDTAAHLHLALTSLAPSGSTLSPPHFRLRRSPANAAASTTLAVALSACLAPSPSSFLLTELSAFIILCVSASPLC